MLKATIRKIRNYAIGTLANLDSISEFLAIGEDEDMIRAALANAREMSGKLNRAQTNTHQLIEALDAAANLAAHGGALFDGLDDGDEA